MRAAVALLLSIPAQLAAQQAPRFLYIYRDSLKSGVDSAYGAIEDHAAQVCADLECPNPYLGLESLSGPHEAWWVNAFATEADTTRVVNAYAANRPLMEALGAVTSPGRRAWWARPSRAMPSIAPISAVAQHGRLRARGSWRSP